MVANRSHGRPTGRRPPRPRTYAFLLAFRYSAEISLLHVIERASESVLEPEKEQVVKRLRALVPADAQNWATVVPAVRAGKSYQEILDYASEMQIDLIVMEVQGRSAINLALFGSTTHRVLQLGPCPVLVVRGPHKAETHSSVLEGREHIHKHSEQGDRQHMR